MLSLSVAFWSCGDDDKTEEFVWNGDWNDPDDPNYKPEGYNPIQGLWKRDDDGTKGLYYSEDFKIYQVYFTSSGYIEKDLWREYVINDKAYMATNNEKWRYKIEGNALKITYKMNSDDDWRSYTRVEE